MLSSKRLWEIIEEELQEQSFKDSDRNLETAFNAQFGDLKIRRFKEINSKLCRVAQIGLNENEDLDHQFGAFVSKAQDSIRLKVAQAIGFDEEIEKIQTNTGKSDRDLFIEFLLELEVDIEWSSSTLRKWRGEIGRKLHERIYKKAGWNLAVVEHVLGEGHLDLLSTRPLIHKREIKNHRDCRALLIELMESLEPGQAMSSYTVKNWRSKKDGVSGKKILGHIQKHFGTWSETTVRAILKSDADRLIEENPIKEQEKQIKSPEIARQLLITFIKGRAGEWKRNDLDDPNLKIGSVKGKTLARYLDRHFGGWNLTILTEFLGESAHLLEAAPYTKQKKSPKKPEFIPIASEAENLPLWLAVGNGDPHAESILFAKKGYLVGPIARKYLHKTGITRLTEEDLIQEGKIGLIEAIRRYDIERGVLFRTYARWWIEALIKKALSDQGHIVRIPIDGREKLRRINKYIQKAKEAGVTPSIEIIAEEFGMTAEKVQDLIEADKINKTSPSLDESPFEDGDSMQERIGGVDPNFRLVETTEQMILILQILAGAYTSEEITLFCKAHGVNGYERKSIKEIYNEDTSRYKNKERIQRKLNQMMKTVKREMNVKVQ